MGHILSDKSLLIDKGFIIKSNLGALFLDSMTVHQMIR